MGDTHKAGVKFDNDKTEIGFLPWAEIEEVAKVLDFGAAKYDRSNWKKGMRWMRLVSACFRHITKWVLGERLDPETGLSHLAHAVCNLLFLMWYQNNDVGEDDREL